MLDTLSILKWIPDDNEFKTVGRKLGWEVDSHHDVSIISASGLHPKRF